MPTLGGLIFNYVDHYLVYKLMFVWGVLLGTINTIIFWFVDPDEEEADAAQQDTAQRWHNGPIGARLCDWLCFWNAMSTQSARVQVQHLQQQQEQEEQHPPVAGSSRDESYSCTSTTAV